MKNKTSKAILNQYSFGSIWVFNYLRCPECEFKTKEDNSLENHAIKNHPISFECDICGKVLDEDKTSKAILNQFMRGKKLMNVTFVVKYWMKNKLQRPY